MSGARSSMAASSQPPPPKKTFRARSEEFAESLQWWLEVGCLVARDPDGTQAAQSYGIGTATNKVNLPVITAKFDRTSQQLEQDLLKLAADSPRPRPIPVPSKMILALAEREAAAARSS